MLILYDTLKPTVWGTGFAFYGVNFCFSLANLALLLSRFTLKIEVFPSKNSGLNWGEFESNIFFTSQNVAGH
jgi:hypothetical protein